MVTFAFACRLDIDRGATLVSRIGAVAGEGALKAVLAFHATHWPVVCRLRFSFLL